MFMRFLVWFGGHMFRMDDQNMTIAQKVADFVQTWTGYDCLDQSRAGYALAAIGAANIWVSWTWPFNVWKLPGSVVYFLMILAFSVAVIVPDPENRKIRADVERGLMNHRRIKPANIAIRVYSILLFFFSLALFLALPRDMAGVFLWMTGQLIYSHLRACNPNPPSKSKIRQIIEDIRAYGKLVPVGVEG